MARALKFAERLSTDDDGEFAVGRAYYAMFYTAEALLNEMGFRFANTAVSMELSASTLSRPG